MLDTTDIPRHDRVTMDENVSYPSQDRFTLQWMLTPKASTQAGVPNNSDAAFIKHTRKPKPSKLLLHYNYGAAAVKCWGRGTQVLTEYANPPRPSVPVPAPMGPSRISNDRTTTVRKLNVARAADGGNAQPGTRKGAEESVDSEGRALMDEDEVMLFFWGNTPAAKQRHLKRVQEETERMGRWRGDILV